MRGLYVHIPFCSQKCHYCDFVITVNRSDAMRKRFFSSLQKEIEFVKRKYGTLIFDTLYLGGGTPSLLDSGEMSHLLGILRSDFEFQDGHELTCEINPGDVSEEKLKSYRDLGINRASLGAQSLNDQLLQAMGRTHSAGDIVKTMELLQKTGFDNVSIDFILKLPNQTVKDVQNSIEKVVQLGAKQVSLYDLDVHEKTVYGRLQKLGKLDLPTDDQHEQMFACAETVLSAAGFFPYEVSNFARPGFESKHNLIYWHNQEYLGLGPGAFSYMSRRRSQMTTDVSQYLSKCEAGDFTSETDDMISAEEHEIENLMTGLRSSKGVNLNEFILTKSRFSGRLDLLVEKKLISRSDNRVALTRRGRFLCETVIQHLISKE